MMIDQLCHPTPALLRRSAALLLTMLRFLFFVIRH
jgi:hypothetical protein